jgi:DNA topoisomerase-2
MLELFFKNIVDTAMITGVQVFYNDTKIPMKNLKDYASMYGHTEYVMLETSDSNVVLASNTTDSWKPVSFINGCDTVDGGTHVDLWTESLLRPVLEKINKTVKKGGKTLTIKDIRPFFRLFLNCNIINPSFTSQEKTKQSRLTL